MVAALQHLGRSVTESILLATVNPFNALFIGLLVTAMLQSSSTTTSLVVALVASGSLPMESAIPIIMGANVGTTITSTIVSLGFINKKKEFRRAVAAGTYHDFFNILTVVILFPLEYYYGFLSNLSSWIAQGIFKPSTEPVVEKGSHFLAGFDYIISVLLEVIPSGFVLAVLALLLLFSSILIFRRLISDLLKVKSPEVFSRFFFRNQFKSFAFGLLTTAAIRSSTITTSVVVPIVAKRIVSLKQAAPFIMGANIGTTITAFIAATLHANTSSALSIAIAHFLFNFIGVLIFFPIPVLRKLPIELASRLGKLTLRYRLVGFVYLLGTFFFVPFTLIYFNQDSVKNLKVTYEQNNKENVSYYRMAVRMNPRTQHGEWTQFKGKTSTPGEEPSLIYPVYVKNTTLFIGNEMVLFNRPGFCWDGERDHKKYRVCIEKILPHFTISHHRFDSVFVYDLKHADTLDSTVHRYFYSAPYKIMLQHEITNNGDTIVLEKLVDFVEK